MSTDDKSLDELIEIFKEDEQLLAPLSMPKKEQKPKLQDEYLEREKAKLLEWARNEIEQYKNRIRALEALIAMLEGIDPNEESQYVIIDTEIWKEVLKKKGIEAGPYVLIGWIKSGSLVTRYYARLVLEELMPLNDKVKERINEVEQSLRKKQLAAGRKKDLARVDLIMEAEKVKEIRVDNIYSREDLHIAKGMLREIAELLLLEAPD
ncbi:MAG: hypothetical protein N3F67_06290, partial [Acidilobaceae archaeon]|nr:hypothetical protein [Acidilobaceae archaeon]